MIYHVAKAMVIFSHVKITCYFHMQRYQVFAWKLSWYFIGVYITKCIIIIFIIITTMYSGTLPYCHLRNTVTLLLWPLFLGPAKWPYIHLQTSKSQRLRSVGNNNRRSKRFCSSTVLSQVSCDRWSKHTRSSDRRSEHLSSKCVLCIPYILSGSPNKCWIHTCDAWVVTT